MKDVTAKEAQIALGQSIRHWENIAIGKESEKGVSNCPLCKLFYNDDCKRCPVYARTSSIECYETPYRDWLAHVRYCTGASNPHFSDVSGNHVQCTKCASLAMAEVSFLTRLHVDERAFDQQGYRVIIEAPDACIGVAPIQLLTVYADGPKAGQIVHWGAIMSIETDGTMTLHDEVNEEIPINHTPTGSIKVGY